MGYFDLQVNGYGGTDLNKEDLTAEELGVMCRHLRKDGVESILATFCTECLELMEGRMARVAALREQDGLAKEMIVGFHVEGPFINETEGYRGAHPREAIIPADGEVMKRLLEAGAGLVRLVTLAPERDEGFKLTGLLSKAGVVVAAGHCNPNLDELAAGIDAGVSMFTHLGNGVPMKVNRHDNIIQRALSLAERMWLCFIADGVHIPPAALGNYLRAAGLERCIVVTDAMLAAGMGPGKYSGFRREFVVDENLAAWEPGHKHLLGSAVTMNRSVANLRTHLGLDEQEVKLLTEANPRAALGRGVV